MRTTNSQEGVARSVSHPRRQTTTTVALMDAAERFGVYGSKS